MEIKSPAFRHEFQIPAKYTCDGENINPEITIKDVPLNANSLVFIIDDPDAISVTGKVWVHWLIFNMPVDITKIQEGREPEGVKGKNSFEELGYQGPCPPDKEHRYFFKLYALDNKLDLDEGATKDEVERAIKGHIIAEAMLMGKYKRT